MLKREGPPCERNSREPLAETWNRGRGITEGKYVRCPLANNVDAARTTSLCSVLPRACSSRSGSLFYFSGDLRFSLLFTLLLRIITTKSSM